MACNMDFGGRELCVETCVNQESSRCLTIASMQWLWLFGIDQNMVTDTIQQFVACPFKKTSSNASINLTVSAVSTSCGIRTELQRMLL